jgi:allantoinase
VSAYDLAIVGSTVVMPGGAAPAEIAVRDGRIAALLDPGERIDAAEIVDARRLVTFPGAVEPHCHFWDPGPTVREDWETGTRAAAAGGITTVIEMPLSDPPTVDAAAIELKRQRAVASAHVDWALWGGIVPDSIDAIEQRVAELRAGGAVAFKAFMCWSAREYPPVDDGDLLLAMKALAASGGLLGLHAENDAIIRRLERTLQAEGRTDPQSYVDSRPELAEAEAVQRAVALAEAVGASIYIVHMSSPAAVEIVRQAKQRGVRVYAETAPQYLLLDRSLLDALGPYAKCAPPLRSPESVERLWRYVLDGTIDTIGSDHAPFTQTEKAAGLTDIWQAPNGLTGIETMVAAVFSEARRRGVSLERIAQLLAVNAAHIFGLGTRKGRVAVGADGDFTVLDPDRGWVVDDESLHYKNRWSPYRGLKLRGKVVRTIVRGTTVAVDGDVVERPGFGQQIRPTAGIQGMTAAPSRL